MRGAADFVGPKVAGAVGGLQSPLLCGQILARVERDFSWGLPLDDRRLLSLLS
jgi:hypothetical protein